MKTSLIVKLGFGILGFVIIVSQVYLSQLKDIEPDNLPQAVDTKCVLSEASCKFTLKGRSASIDISGNLKALTPFQLNMEVLDLQIESAIVRLEMVGMDMGDNSFMFVQSGNTWQADVVIPVCTTGRRDWKLTLDINTNKNRFRRILWLQL